MNFEQWRSELSRFADIDAPLSAEVTNGRWIARFRQQGADVELTMSEDDGKLSLRRDSDVHQFGSYRGLLSSQYFGNLSYLARVQKTLASSVVSGSADDIVRSDIPLAGDVTPSSAPQAHGNLLDEIDHWTGQGDSAGVRALVIDGPAGIGKTHVIRKLVQRRAQSYGPDCRPLILHVESRGRQLTTLHDRLAGVLQALRLGLTYDQVPILLRHGLLQIAIDGFDELADPNGYETAWHSLNDLVKDIEFGGVLLLAGRDTFIDAQSVRTALPSLAERNVGAAHLRVPSPQEAIAWLTSEGVSAEKTSHLQEIGLLDVGGYSLRPFFLRQIRFLASSATGFDRLASFPLQSLIDAMIRREAPLAAKLVPALTAQQVEDLLRRLLCEAARDMADYESENIDVASLELLAEITFAGSLKDEQLRALRNRVKSVALLEQDSNADQRRFVHTEIQAYFLAESLLDLLSKDDLEISRALRRNILGTDFLEIFHDVCQCAVPERFGKFRQRAIEILRTRRYDGRTNGNISSLLLASADISLDPGFSVYIEDVALDECILRGTLVHLAINRVSFSQLDVRGADLSDVVFNAAIVHSLILDAGTLVPTNFPRPKVLVIDSQGAQERIFAPEDIEAFVRDVSVADGTSQSISAQGSIGKLLDKLCRTILRQTWIRKTEGDRAARLLDDPNWPQLKELLARHELVEENSRKQASGQSSQFVRIRHAADLLDPRSGNELVVAFRRSLEAHLAK